MPAPTYLMLRSAPWARLEARDDADATLVLRGRFLSTLFRGGDDNLSGSLASFRVRHSENAESFRRRLGERPSEQFGEGCVGEIEPLPAGRTPRHRQDLGLKIVLPSAVIGVGG